MIRPFDYLKLLPEIEDEVVEALRRVLRSGRLILGPETSAFEEEFAAWAGARHCVAVSNGTTALEMALRGLGVGPGDEVVVPANTCAPTISAVRLCGATPVIVDVGEDDLQMDPARVEAALTPRTRVVMPVHLWGLAAPVEALLAMTRARGIDLVEDCAQAHGTTLGGRLAGTLGRAGCYSFYPTKNLGAYGEGGAIVTDDDDLAKRLRMVRMYGYDGAQVSEIEGGNFRITEMQAAILRIKLRVFPDWLRRRRAGGDAYLAGLAGSPFRLPVVRPGTEPSWHQFVVRCPDRAAATAALDAADIGWGIHYAVPLHRMPAFGRFTAAGGCPVADAASGSILSLPLHEALTAEEIATVCGALRGR